MNFVSKGQNGQEKVRTCWYGGWRACRVGFHWNSGYSWAEGEVSRRFATRAERQAALGAKAIDAHTLHLSRNPAVAAVMAAHANQHGAETPSPSPTATPCALFSPGGVERCPLPTVPSSYTHHGQNQTIDRATDRHAYQGGMDRHELGILYALLSRCLDHVLDGFPKLSTLSSRLESRQRFSDTANVFVDDINYAHSNRFFLLELRKILRCWNVICEKFITNKRTRKTVERLELYWALYILKN